MLVEKSLQAFREQPQRISEWMALRRAASEAQGRATRASRATEDEADAQEEGRSGGSHAEPAAAADAADAADAVDAGVRLRARLRWRMALTYARFTRVLTLQRTHDYRLVDVSVVEPRTEGLGPRRHTTYLISSRVRGAEPQAKEVSPDGWMHCRKRFSEAIALRDALIAFLPGAEQLLPELPDKVSGSGRFSTAVVEQRREGVAQLLRCAMDYPILCSADTLAAFVGWPEGVRGPIFARAQTAFLSAPKSPQRMALERVHALRRQQSQLDSHQSPTIRGDASEGSVSVTSTPHWSRSPRVSSAALNGSRCGHLYGATSGATDDGGHADFSERLSAAIYQTADEAARIVQRQQRSRPSSRQASRQVSRLSDDHEDGDAHPQPARPVRAPAARQAQPPRHPMSERHAAAASAAAVIAEAVSGIRADASAVLAEVDGSHSIRRDHSHLPARAGLLHPVPAAFHATDPSADPSADPSVALALLRKLDEIEGRLRQLERRSASSWLFDRIFGCGGIQR